MTQLFDPATYTAQQAASLVNIPGMSLAATNSAAQIAAVQANPGVITPQSMTATNPLAITNPNPSAIPDVASLQVPLTPDLQPTAQEQKATGLTSKIGDLYNSLTGKSSYQKEEDTAFGVDKAQQSITDLSSQLVGLKNEALAIPLNLQNNSAGISTGVLNTMTDAALRTNAVKALSVNSLLASFQGQLSNAKAMADKAVSAKFDPIQEQIDAALKNLELIKSDPNTSIQDKNRAQKQIDIQNQKTAQTAQAKQEAADIFSIANDAAANSQNFKPTSEYKTAGQAAQAILNAPDKGTALRIAISTGMSKASATSSTSDITEYNLAKSQGYKGTFQQWVDRSTQYKGTTGGGAGKTTPTTPTFDYNKGVANLKAQEIPVAGLNKNGTLSSSYNKKLLDKGLTSPIVDWFWGEVTGGTSFEDIRQEMRSKGADTGMLDTFVQTLQGK